MEKKYSITGYETSTQKCSKAPKLRHHNSSSAISLKCFGTLALEGLSDYNHDVSLQEFKERCIGEHPEKIIDVRL